jgi:hypothetical protein
MHDHEAGAGTKNFPLDGAGADLFGITNEISAGGSGFDDASSI